MKINKQQMTVAASSGSGGLSGLLSFQVDAKLCRPWEVKVIWGL